MDRETLTSAGFLAGGFRVVPLRLAIATPGGDLRVQPRVMDVLVALAAQAGQVVTRETLLSEVWRDREVGDHALNRCILELRRVLDDPALGPAIETVPRVGYRLCWPVHALPPEAPPSSADAPATVSGPGRISGAGIALAAASVLIGVWIVLAQWPGRAPVAPDLPATALDPRVIAVLPFDNLTGNPQDAHLVDGISEELAHALARMPGLRVIARTSAQAVKDSGVDAVQAGQRLAAGHLVEGSVRRDGDRLRIKSRLVDTSSGEQLWSRSDERALGGLFELQQQLATDLSEQLASYLTGPVPAASPAPVAPAAYEAYLEARRAERIGTPDAWRDALDRYREAARLAPDFAQAHAGVGRAELWVNRALATQHPDALDALVLPHLQRALELDPALGEAYVTRGWLRRWTARAGGEDAYRAAIEVDPSNAIAHQSLAAYELQQGHFRKALELSARAHELDPLSSVSHAFHNTLLAAFGMRDALDHSLARMTFIAERDAPSAGSRCFGEVLAGRHGRALDCVAQARDRFGPHPSLLHTEVAAAASVGDRERLLQVLSELAGQGDPGAAARLASERADVEQVAALAARCADPAMDRPLATQLGIAASEHALWEPAMACFERAELARHAVEPAVRQWGAVQALPYLVVVEQQLGYDLEAGRHLDLLLELSARPLNEGVVHVREHLQRSLALALAGRRDEAVAEFEIASRAIGSPFELDTLLRHPAYRGL
ncbi:MAG: winged helix-turn-helix domain-containing protein, partial [Xanthomonadales bacterium]|nr:winged helix-turn-helix domain-containing protein [Xanthomonadales bacterium]